MEHKKVAIVGAGPAGVTAAIQLKRYRIDFVIFEKEAIGGLLRNAYCVENYPGFPSGIKGTDLVRQFEKQLLSHDIQITFEEVRSLTYQKQHYLIETNRSAMTSDMVVIGSGTKPKTIHGLTLPESLQGQVLYEIVPILKMKNKRIVIVGAGDGAFDYALNLSQNNHVTILNRSGSARCLPLLRERVEKSRKISYLKRAIVEDVDRIDSQIRLIYRQDNRSNQIDSDYLVLAIGREPCLDFLEDGLKHRMNDLKKKDRFFMIGDVRNDLYRQTGICVGDGIKAAMTIYQKLRPTDR